MKDLKKNGVRVNNPLCYYRKPDTDFLEIPSAQATGEDYLPLSYHYLRSGNSDNKRLAAGIKDLECVFASFFQKLDACY